MSAPDPDSLPLFKPQRRALRQLRALLAGYDGRELMLYCPDSPRLVPQCELAVSCDGRGQTLRVRVTLRRSSGAGWAPVRQVSDWDGNQRHFDWECSPKGRARWLGAAPAVALSRPGG